MFKQNYTVHELHEILKKTTPRKGWDFSQMNTASQPVPWNYIDILKIYIESDDSVLDIGTGGGERFIELSGFFKNGVGVDSDPAMIEVAIENAKEISNISFYRDTEKLEKTKDTFDVVLNRHAPFDLLSIIEHLKPEGYFITQQVGFKNMLNIKQALHAENEAPVITQHLITHAGLTVIAFMEYNIEYIVRDIESLVFWLQALDMLHADLDGERALADIDIFNRIIQGNVDERGFVTNEHRYLAIAQRIQPST